MTETNAVLQTLISLVTLAVLLYGFYRMIQITAEARAARANATAASLRAEMAANNAHTAAIASTLAVSAVASDVHALGIKTDGITTALVASTAKASLLEGRAEVTAEIAEAAKTETA